MQIGLIIAYKQIPSFNPDTILVVMEVIRSGLSAGLQAQRAVKLGGQSGLGAGWAVGPETGGACHAQLVLIPDFGSRASWCSEAHASCRHARYFHALPGL